MSCIAGVLQACRLRLARELTGRQVVWDWKLGAPSFLHTTSAVWREIESDIQHYQLKMGSLYLKGDKEGIKQNIRDRRVQLDADDLVSVLTCPNCLDV